MALFDVSKYEQPKADKIDMELTKYYVGIFLTAYKSARSRVGQPSEPKVTSSFSLVPPSFSNQFSSSVEDAVIRNNESITEFVELHELFNKGYSAITHPFKTEVTDRRRKIFIMRYINGLPVDVICERINYQNNVVTDESKEALIQFAGALELLKTHD